MFFGHNLKLMMLIVDSQLQPWLLLRMCRTLCSIGCVANQATSLSPCHVATSACIKHKPQMRMMDRKPLLETSETHCRLLPLAELWIDISTMYQIPFRTSQLSRYTAALAENGVHIPTLLSCAYAESEWNQSTSHLNQPLSNPHSHCVRLSAVGAVAAQQQLLSQQQQQEAERTKERQLAGEAETASFVWMM